MRLAAFIAYALTTTTAMAHGGHEEARTMGDAHWLASADHLLMLILGGLALGIGAYAAFRLARSSRTRA